MFINAILHARPWDNVKNIFTSPFKNPNTQPIFKNRLNPAQYTCLGVLLNTEMVHSEWSWNE